MPEVPTFNSTMNPMLEVLREAGTPLSIEELDRRVIAHMALPAEVLAVPHDPTKPDRSEVSYRMAWARSWLKNGALIDNPMRGKWTITQAGRDSGTIDPASFVSQQSKKYREGLQKSGTGAEESRPAESSEAAAIEAAIESWEEEAGVARVGPELEKRLRDTFERLGQSGALLTQEQITGMLERFRDRFGPEALASVDGLELLKRMHGRGERDSLVHWLEFKDDPEFESGRFGSIAGGSALKFGIYQSVESGAWMSGTPHQQLRLETEQAVALVRSQRDELLAMERILRSAAQTEIDDEELQERLNKVAPTLSQAAWAHKLLAVWFPELIDTFHVEEYRQHHLRRLLKLWGSGRFYGTSLFRGIAKQLSMTLLELARVLVEENGEPYRTWRIGTRIQDASVWPDMQVGRYVGVGWDKLGSLADIPPTREGKAQVRALLEQQYTNTAAILTRKAGEIFALVKTARERDLVVAMDGARVLGVGMITGGYEHIAGAAAPHRRRVEWELVGQWELPESEGVLTTFIQLQKHPHNLLEIEARLLGRTTAALGKSAAVLPIGAAPAQPEPEAPPPPLDKFTQRVESILARKRQLILYGPPGTGKTHLATLAAKELAARAWFKREHAALSEVQRRELDGAQAVEWISFHPAYGYEDFLEGFRPTEKGTFERRDGVMKRVCERAKARPDRPFYLLIDEINRGDIPRIFGELLSVMEKDKRGRPITLPLTGESFFVPENVYVLGTMNTADRSIALLDAALRRRFGFIELLPDPTLFKGVMVGRIPLQAWLETLNARILEYAGRDARNLRVGHAYFLQGGTAVLEFPRFADILREDVIPLLEEVCYENYEALDKILGSKIVLSKKRCIDESLFEPGRLDALQEAILLSMPELGTSAAATVAETTEPDPLDPEEPEDAEAS